MILEKLARYQLWADDIARGLVGDLTDEEFTREILPPFGSIQSLCAHIRSRSIRSGPSRPRTIRPSRRWPTAI